MNPIDALVPQPGALAHEAAATAHALRLLLESSRSAETRRAYASDLNDFFRFHSGGAATTSRVAALIALDSGGLALALNEYKAYLHRRGLAEATVNRRLAAVRALLRFARRLGAPCPDPAGLVSSEKARPYRDTRGPGLAGVQRLLAAPDRLTLRGRRDYALLLLLCENGLRRAEVVRVNVGDLDLAARRLAILGKGRGSQKEHVTLSEVACFALAEYLSARAAGGSLAADAALFTNAARQSDGTERLTGRGVLHVVNRYGVKVLGAPLHPHALRHTAITAALDATGGDVRRVQRFSRHANVATLQRYDDNRRDLQGEVTQLLSSMLHDTA